MIVADTSGLLAALASDEPAHATTLAAIESDPAPLVVSPFVLAEVDYHVVSRMGVDTDIDFLADVARGGYVLASFEGEEVAQAAAVISRYRDLAIGLADASIVVLAGRYRTNRVLTLDERHFRALRTPTGEPFVVLPADAPCRSKRP